MAWGRAVGGNRRQYNREERCARRSGVGRFTVAAKGTEEDGLKVRGFKEREAKGGELKEDGSQSEGGNGVKTGAAQTTDGEGAARQVTPLESAPARAELDTGARGTRPVDGAAGTVAGGV